jgi:TetR/AcrR family transcriptional regulator, transcriptional repressor for nem operon
MDRTPGEGPSASKQATRERIVARAATLMSERGVARTRLDDVRQAAGVSGSQLSHHFRDKRTLVRAVISHQADAVVDVHRRVAPPESDPLEALYLWADLVVTALQDRGCRGGCTLGALAGELTRTVDDVDVLADLVTGFDRWSAVLRACLRAMSDRGELAPEADPDELALGLLAVLEGGALLAQLRREVDPLVTALNAVLARIRSLAGDRGTRAGNRRVTGTDR